MSEAKPLPYFTEQQERAKFDPWKDFIVTSDCAVESQPDGSLGGVRLDAPEQFHAPKAL